MKEPSALFTQDRPQAEAQSEPQQSAVTEAQVTETVQAAGAVASALVPKFAPVIAAGVELEPEVYHFISGLIHLFKKKK
jgi:hypothetical protein